MKKCKKMVMEIWLPWRAIAKTVPHLGTTCLPTESYQIQKQRVANVEEKHPMDRLCILAQRTDPAANAKNMEGRKKQQKLQLHLRAPKEVKARTRHARMHLKADNHVG